MPSASGSPTWSAVKPAEPEQGEVERAVAQAERVLDGRHPRHPVRDHRPVDQEGGRDRQPGAGQLGGKSADHPAMVPGWPSRQPGSYSWPPWIAADEGGDVPAPPGSGEARLLAACRRQPVDRTPVWFMRQAGRCLAGYRKLRERYDILTLTRTPELAAEVTAMPVEVLGVDGAVLYADIMLPLLGMGVPFSIDPGVGPIVHQPVNDEAAVARLRIVEAEEATPELFETIRLLRRELAGRAGLIGFAGAPYTVASYLIEGRPSREHARAKALMYGQPATWRRLMETLTEVTVRYLRAQVAAGVQVVQLFDSWMGDLGRREYEANVLPWSRRIFDALRGTGVPSIHFGTGTVGLLEPMAAAGSDLVSVDWRVPLDQAWSRIGHDRGIQGNLDPAVLLAPFEVVTAEADRILQAAGGRPGHVFNLGHGVLPDTPVEHLAGLVEHVHRRSARDRAPAMEASR
jgi:uroporphyrinogen decarboxylase